MTGFLSTFSKPFQLAVLLWPFVSVLLTVPAAVYLYRRDNRLRPVSVLGAYAFMLYVLGLGCFTLYPWPQDPAAYCAPRTIWVRSSTRCSSLATSAPTV